MGAAIDALTKDLNIKTTIPGSSKNGGSAINALLAEKPKAPPPAEAATHFLNPLNPNYQKNQESMQPSTLDKLSSISETVLDAAAKVTGIEGTVGKGAQIVADTIKDKNLPIKETIKGLPDAAKQVWKDLSDVVIGVPAAVVVDTALSAAEPKTGDVGPVTPKLLGIPVGTYQSWQSQARNLVEQGYSPLEASLLNLSNAAVSISALSGVKESLTDKANTAAFKLADLAEKETGVKLSRQDVARIVNGDPTVPAEKLEAWKKAELQDKSLVDEMKKGYIEVATGKTPTKTSTILRNMASKPITSVADLARVFRVTGNPVNMPNVKLLTGPSTTSVDKLDTYPIDPLDRQQVDLVKDTILKGGSVEPIKVIKQGDRFDVEDGQHRLQAYKELGYDEVPTMQVEGPKPRQSLREQMQAPEAAATQPEEAPAKLSLREQMNVPEGTGFQAPTGTLREQMLNPESGFISAGDMATDIKKALADIKAGRENAKFGETLRSYTTSNRDIRIAESSQLAMKIDKMLPDPQDREALLLYRQFKNNPAKLEASLSGTRDSYEKLRNDYLEENPSASPKELEGLKQEAVGRVQALKPVLDRIKNPSPAIIEADKMLTEYFTKQLKEGQELNILDSKINPEEYITQLLTPKKAPSKVVNFGGKFSKRFKFAKQRSYEDVLDAVIRGRRPQTLNATDALRVYGENYANPAARKLLIQQLKDTDMGKFLPSGSKKIPEGWVELAPGSNLFKNEIPIMDQEGAPDIMHQSFYVPEKVADALSPLFEPSALRKLKWFRNIRAYQGLTKLVNLSLSVFHLKALEMTSLANQGFFKTIKSQMADMESKEFLDAEKELVRAGGTTPILHNQYEVYRKLEKSSLPTRKELLLNTPGVKQLNQFADNLTKLTFDVTMRKMKVIDFAMKDAQWKIKNPNATPEEHLAAQRSLAKQVNATYGGLHWENLGVKKDTIELARGFLLAPDWTFSNFLNAKYAFGSGPAGAAARKFWIMAAVWGYALTQATSLMLSGKRSKDPTSVYFGKDKNGKDIYQNIFFVGAPGDMVSLIKNIKDYGAVIGTSQTIANKLAPLPKASIDLLTNKNYLGQDIVPKGAGPVAGTGRALYQVGQQALPIPFSGSNLVSMLTDPKKQYTPMEYFTALFGSRPRHVIPEGMRQVPSGSKKGQLVPQTEKQKNREKLPIFEQIKTGKVYKPLKK